MSESIEILFQSRTIENGKVTLDIQELRMYGENLRAMITLTPERAKEYIRCFEYHVLRSLTRCNICRRIYNDKLIVCGVCPTCLRQKCGPKGDDTQ